ncbi:AAA family ATPase [Celerinatantimonas sp. YJH-8]|uniref:AAA family ATPase n=1 Tax=Celerinatantimonas sp. YJH-8 TaxID=3228714 RepID=UPI0038C6B63B
MTSVNEFDTGTLIFFSGKMGAGKSTRSQKIALERHAVLLSEDEWLATLYPDQISSVADYIKYSNRLKPQIKKLVQSILVAGTDVVMDFPANTRLQRAWFREIFTEVQAPHCLIFVDVTNERCLRQIAQRQVEQPERMSTDTAEMFEQMTKYFVEPTSDENFNITIIS